MSIQECIACTRGFVLSENSINRIGLTSFNGSSLTLDYSIKEEGGKIIDSEFCPQCKAEVLRGAANAIASKSCVYYIKEIANPLPD